MRGGGGSKVTSDSRTTPIRHRQTPFEETTMKRTAVTLATALFAAAAFGTLHTSAWAGPPVTSPEMKTALEKAAEGPDSLRRYVQRTRMIYGLDYAEVMAVHEARVAALATADEAAKRATEVASRSQTQR
jgi:hypothetical protein